MAPPLRRRRLARTLQELRERTDLNVTEAAKLAGFSQAKLSRIETAQIAISGDDTFALCEVLGVAPEVTEALVTLARQAKRRGWWKTYPDTILGQTTDLLELEADADSVHFFTLDVVPGLFQTEAYAAAVIQHGFPRESAEELEQRVAVRLARQRHVESGKLEIWTIIDEPALRRPIGGRQVMADQLDKLVDVSGRRQVSIQVLPFNIAGHLAMSTPFMMFTLGDGYRCVALDSLTGGLYIEDEAEVRVYGDTWSKLAASALSFESSAILLREIADDHRRQVGEPRPRPRGVAEEPGV